MAAGASRTLKLSYVGDSSRLNKANKEAETGLQKLGKGFAKFGKIAAAGFAVAGAASLVVAKKLFEAGEAAATANARIENITESMDLFGDEAGAVSGRLVDLANTQAKLTGVSRNTIKETSALLLTFRSVAQSADEVGGVFDRAQEAALDLAAAGFGSATSNAQSLGRALEDPIRGLTSLTRQGVTFTDAERERIKVLVESNRVGEAQELILAAIEQQVGGTAEATANASDKLRESFGVLVDSVALALAPAFEKLTAVAQKVIDRLVELWATHGPRIIDFVQRAQVRFSEWWSTLRERFEPIIRDVIARLRDFIATARDWWERVSPGVISAFRTLVTPLRDLFSAVRNLWDQFVLLIGAFRTGESNGRGFETFIRVLVGAVRLAISAMQGLINIMSRVIDSLRKLVESRPFQLAIEGFRLIARGIGALTGASADTPPPTPIPPVPTPRSGGNTNITVNTGVGDPAAISREIERLLQQETSRAGSYTPVRTVSGRFS
jgi:hypothetical protein